MYHTHTALPGETTKKEERPLLPYTYWQVGSTPGRKRGHYSTTAMQVLDLRCMNKGEIKHT
jgi:hypothetical protein